MFTLSDKNDLEEGLKRFVYDINFQKTLIQNASRYVDKFLVNKGTASKNFANILKSY